MAKHTLKSCGVHTARFLKCVWAFYNIMHERVKPAFGKYFCKSLEFLEITGI